MLGAKKLIQVTSDYERGRTLVKRGLALLTSNDRRNVAFLNLLAHAMWVQGEYKNGEQIAEKARLLAKSVEDQAGLAASLKRLGAIAVNQAKNAIEVVV